MQGSLPPVVLQTYEPSLKRTIQLGKFALLPAGRPVYRVDLPPADRLSVLDAWGIAPCVLDAMGARGIALIHLHVKGRPDVLETTRAEVLKYGVLKSFRGRTVRHYHLPRVYWRTVADYRLPWASEVLTLPWSEAPAEAPKPAVAEQPRLL